MRKDQLAKFNSVLFSTFKAAAEQTSSEYEGHTYVRRALVHYLITGEVDKFPDQESRLRMSTVINQDEVARHLADYLFTYLHENEPRTRMEKRLKEAITQQEDKGESEARILANLRDAVLCKNKDFYGIGSDYVSTIAIRTYESAEIGKLIEEQRAYNAKMAARSSEKFGVTSVRVNRQAVNKCRQEVLDGSQISIQNAISQNNARNGRIIQRPRREYSLDDELFAVTDIGNARENQEDSVLILKHPLNPNHKMLVVADGVGGQEAGEKASQEVVAQMTEWFESLNPIYLREENKRELVTMWNERLQSVNRRVQDRYPGSGSTFVGAIVGDKSTTIGSIGDSRAYLLGNDLELRQVTIDDNVGFKQWEQKWGAFYKESRSGQSRVTVERMLDEKDKVRFANDSNVILGCIGGSGSIRPNFVSMPNDSYKTLLLLSDGVTDCLSDKDLMAITRSTDPREVAKAVVDLAIQNDSYRQDLEDQPNYHPRIPGGKDNTTAAVYSPKKGGNER